MSGVMDVQVSRAIEFGFSQLAVESILRGVSNIDGSDVVYNIHRHKRYRATDPEERVRAETIAFLVLKMGYDASRIETEVVGSHGDFADVVLFKDRECTVPYLVVENKRTNPSRSERDEAEGQAFANAIALGARYAMIDFGGGVSQVWQVEGYGAKERHKNLIGGRDDIPVNYSEEVKYHYIAGSEKDISPADAATISFAVRHAHSIIWAGGKRDPLWAFDEWSKLMFAKVRDERYAANGEPRAFQVGVDEPDVAVANRVHRLYDEAKEQDSSIFPNNEALLLPDGKIASVVRAMQHISFMDTDSDVIGTAFEDFFGSVFRGGLGQYFTMRQIARFAVALVAPTSSDYVLDPTCGSGGFLLETLLQVWKGTDRAYAGRGDLGRIKSDFALQNVFGVEIHPTLARICKISLLLHHDGHSNIVADKSFLAPDLPKERLSRDASFDVIVGNPPFGTKIDEGDEDQLDGTSLTDFAVAEGKSSIQSELVILEKAIRLLKPGGRLAMVLPDGVLNNSGFPSNCPQMREWLFLNGRVTGVISLPDFAFRRSGATNKTSILVFERFSGAERKRLSDALDEHPSNIAAALRRSGLDYSIFFAEANYIGYSPSGKHDRRNDLYNADDAGHLSDDQTGSILGEWNTWAENGGTDDPRCEVAPASSVWERHASHRIDPKYHVYRAHAKESIPDGWKAIRIRDVVQRRYESPDFTVDPMCEYNVLTLSQSGHPRFREAGVGNNPPEWNGLYFANSSSKWYTVRKGDIVYSGIDLWKGVVCYVTPEFDGALVTQEYPVLSVVNDEVDAEFLAMLLRSARLRQAFRAINTGHSNRRRTQEDDFNNVIVYYPDLATQKEIASEHNAARDGISRAMACLYDVEERVDTLLGSEAGWNTDDVFNDGE